MPVHILGVRHHGPGSARSVAAALDALQPEVVVIEGAPELDGIAALAADPGMSPPVAGLVYDVASPRFASFYPLAVFSPEWVALQWALRHQVPVRFADLPAATVLAIRQADIPDGEPEKPAKVTDDEVRSDPLAVLARAAGYADPERWWEDVVEHRTDSLLERFAQVSAAMAQVRAANPALDDEENQRREAAMRRVVREAMGAHESVAVVCGAFHAPALDPSTFPTRAADNRLLAGLPKTKVGATWAPWTNARLSLASGYGAGVTAPGWYHHLFAADAADPIATGWLVKVARSLREHQLEAAPATAVEAVRLAEVLAAVRGRPSAGLDELDDAALTVLGEGSEERMGLVRYDLWVGDVLGAVPESTPMVPLAADLVRWQRRLRLTPSATTTTVEVDLRQPAQLARSTLFHRLRLLGVEWAVPAATGRTTGTFKEGWQLTWRPELSVDLIEASLYGTTLESACAAKLVEDAAAADLPALSRLVESCLLADLPDGLAAVVARLGVQTAHSHDLRELMGTVEPVARTIRYGDVRGLDTSALADLLHVLVTRVSVGLRAGCQALDDDLADRTRAAIESAHRGITLLDDQSLAEPWLAALAALTALDGDVHGSVAGRVDRILLDASLLDADLVAARMSRRLSRAVPGPQSAAWLDAFLTGDALLLLHDRVLLALLDSWVGGIPEETFEDLLPLLRRTFARFSTPERRQLGNLLGHGGELARPAAAADLVDLDRALPAMLATARLLGLAVTV